MLQVIFWTGAEIGKGGWGGISDHLEAFWSPDLMIQAPDMMI